MDDVTKSLKNLDINKDFSKCSKFGKGKWRPAKHEKQQNLEDSLLQSYFPKVNDAEKPPRALDFVDKSSKKKKHIKQKSEAVPQLDSRRYSEKLPRPISSHRFLEEKGNSFLGPQKQSNNFNRPKFRLSGSSILDSYQNLHHDEHTSTEKRHFEDHTKDPRRRENYGSKKTIQRLRSLGSSSKSLSSSLLSVNSLYSNSSDDTNCSSVRGGNRHFPNFFNNTPRQSNTYEKERYVKNEIPRRGSFSISYLKGLCKRSNERLISALKIQMEELSNFFDLPLRKDCVIPVLEFILKLSSIEYELTKQEFFNIILNSSELVRSISSYIEAIEQLSRTVSETEKNAKIVVMFFKEIIQYIPNKTKVDYNDLLLKTIHILKKMDDFPSEFIKTAELCRSILSKKHDLIDDKLINYKSLSVFPLKDDLAEEPLLRPNIVNGPYNTVEDYIDIQFKLLKEDFVSCLRSGLNQHIAQLKERTKIRNHDIFIYNKVLYKGLSENMNPSKNLTHIFEIDKKYLNNRWIASDKLIHGSLLLFSQNNFSTYFIGVFDDRCSSHGDLNISVLIIDKSLKLKKLSEYVMIQSKVFFEPYYHVLNVLKSIHPQIFPMERYLISVNTSSKMPDYLTHSTNYIISDLEIPINDLKSWPDPKMIGLNQSQLEALQAALTRELVVIQGPPGTGKTYLGIKLIDILLENKDKWSDGKSPIFVACYRNNAVDQILDALALNRRSVVRLGGRSDSEILKDSTLKNTVGHLRDPLMNAHLAVLKDELTKIKQKITELEKLKQFINENQGILSIEALSNIMAPHHKKYLSAQNSYENWLLGGEGDEWPGNEPDGSDNILDNPFVKKAKNMTLSKDHPFILLSIKYILKELEGLDFELENFNFSILENYGSDQVEMSPEEIAVLTQLLTYYNDKLFLLRKVINRLNMKESEKQISNLIGSDLASLAIDERWTLYKFWGKEFISLCEKDLEILIEEHNVKLLDFLEKKDLNDGENLRRARVDVIGATTTGAARLHKLLSVVKPRIVIIEEAAEVLEAHAVASLTESCEHLILIGDHKQLRPSPASHISSVKYHLDVSLFERMITNEMECFTLSEQHRMRPEISRLVVPQIYTTLTNHPSVEEYPHIKGIQKNLFFLDHSVSEDELKDNDSHQNQFEAFFILALADYMIKQGYKSESITVLTVYGAQLLFMKSIQKRYPSLDDVEIQVVDNFQGEENDIILLSLVRSNSSTIGFLSKENRVCVALTRAKQALIVIGNMETLQVNSSVWKQMKRTLEDNSSLGESLPLKCETHKRITRVKTSEDFKPLLFGGCNFECGMKLDCDHTCTFLCHPVDKEHKAVFTCQQNCTRKRNCGVHDCTDKCGNECPSCNVELPTVLPCGHDGLKICAGDNLPCKANCSKMLICGHFCPKSCHFDNDNHAECFAICNKPNITCPFKHLCIKQCGEDCGECILDTLIELDCGHIAKGICNEVRDVKCAVEVEKELDCGHIINAPCSMPLDEATCSEKIEVILPCGHVTNVLCSTPLTERICSVKVSKVLPCGHTYDNASCSSKLDELICTEKVRKSLQCGHKVKGPCHRINSSVECPGKCNRLLSCGHECEGKCGQKCPPCTVGVEIDESCGHKGLVPCSSFKGLSRPVDDIGPNYCETVCNEALPCGHICKGTCGECMQGRLHIICNAVCNKQLICTHSCKNKCWNDFHSCSSTCVNKCRHQECKRKCGEICEKCMEPCDWTCSHYQCSKKCWEPCDRPPCLFPCQKTQDCGHPCFGYCGEPCPPVCLMCTQTISEDILKRFILLEDCGHVISQKDASDLLLKSEGLIVCPSCNTPVIKTHFFRGHTKNFFSKYSKVKTKSLATYNTRRSILQDFKNNFKLLNDLLKTNYEGCKSLNKLLQNLVVRTAPIMKNKEFNESKLNLKSLLFICFYVTEALKMTKIEDLNEENSSNLLLRIDHLATYLLSRSKKMSPSEMKLFFKELNRLRCIIDLMQLEQDRNFTPSSAETTKYYKTAKASAYSFKQFTSAEKSSLIECLQNIKAHISSNYLLLSTNDNDFHKITNFFNRYYPINFHSENWHKCSKNHFFYSDWHKENKQCPLCSNDKNMSLFFPK